MALSLRGDEFFAQVASSPPFSHLHPRLAAFFKEYLAGEKVTAFGDRWVLNTHFPPYPSPAFDNLVAHFNRIGEPRLHSVTLGVTNRCSYRCWHCYNAGRSQQDLSLETLIAAAHQLQEQGAIMVALSGGEPLLREDLEEIAAAFDERTCVTLNTTGMGLTRERATSLRDRRIFAVGVSLDSADPDEHDRRRGRRGAFRTAVEALQIAGECGLYPYVVAVATREFLEPENFYPYVDFAKEIGSREIHLLEPCPIGRLAGHSEVTLGPQDRQRLLAYQCEIAGRDDLPAISTFAYLESPHFFGCGAGLTHLYLDGSGEVCPCNLVPLSFGNFACEPLAVILSRMRRYFRQPRCHCVGQALAPHIPEGPLPTPPQVSSWLCEEHLLRQHPVPRFFQLRSEIRGQVGQAELRAAYDRVHAEYDEFWLKEAGKPVAALIEKLDLANTRRVLEAGCGTGFATALLAARLPADCEFVAIDLSPGMLSEARQRLGERTLVRFIAGDALEELKSTKDLDLVFTSWVLGYIPLKPFFAAAGQALRPGGCLAFVVHRENSPRVPLEIFAELVARNPAVLQKQVSFDFPQNATQTKELLESSGFAVELIQEGQVVFDYETPEQVLEHLLKSGAGTAFYEAIDPTWRKELEAEFIRLLSSRQQPGEPCQVVHDYLACLARKASIP